MVLVPSLVLYLSRTWQVHGGNSRMRSDWQYYVYIVDRVTQLHSDVR